MQTEKIVWRWLSRQRRRGGGVSWQASARTQSHTH
jgi:hypothetical protein